MYFAEQIQNKNKSGRDKLSTALPPEMLSLQPFSHVSS